MLLLIAVAVVFLYFSPDSYQLMKALHVYRSEFRPSPALQKPHVMLGYTVIAADTDEEARYLASSLEQAVVNLRTGRPGLLPKPQAGLRWSGTERAVLDEFLACSAIGSAETVRRGLEAFVARTGADEVMIASQVFDHAARVRSYQLAATA